MTLTVIEMVSDDTAGVARLLAPLGTRETFVFSLGKSDRNVGAGGCWGVRPP